MRWVNLWKWVTVGFIFAAVVCGVFIRPGGRPWGLIGTAIFLGFGYKSFGIYRHRGRIVGEGSEGEALVAKVLDNLQMDARVLHSVHFDSGDRAR